MSSTSPRRGPRRGAALGRAHDRVDAVQRDAAQEERHDGGRQVVAAGEAARRDGAAVARLGEDVGERGAADGVDAPAQRSDSSGRSGASAISARSMTFGRADGPQRVALGVDAARSRR